MSLSPVASTSRIAMSRPATRVLLSPISAVRQLHRSVPASNATPSNPPSPSAETSTSSPDNSIYLIDRQGKEHKARADRVFNPEKGTWATRISNSDPKFQGNSTSDGFIPIAPRPRWTPDMGLPTKTSKGKPIKYRPPTYLHSPATIPTIESHFHDQQSLTHPLWSFFHLPEGANPIGGLGVELSVLKAKKAIMDERKGKDGGGKEENMRGLEQEGKGEGLGSLETLLGENSNLTSGRAWTAPELRLKSFKDLHTLWYVLVRERNVLATQREERRRLGIQFEPELVRKRTFRCRKSMARIKYVLNERRLALLAVTNATRPATHPSILVQGKSPLGTADPLSLSGFEGTAGSSSSLSSLEESLLAESEVNEEVGDDGAESGGEGDGERQKSGEADREVIRGGQGTVVGEGEVGKSEVESRDEGFGGGREGREFVKEMEKAGL